MGYRGLPRGFFLLAGGKHRAAMKNTMTGPRHSCISKCASFLFLLLDGLLLRDRTAAPIEQMVLQAPACRRSHRRWKSAAGQQIVLNLISPPTCVASSGARGRAVQSEQSGPRACRCGDPSFVLGET